VQREADDLVDLILGQDAVGAGEVGRVIARALVDHGGPFGRHVAGVVRAALLGERGAPFVGERRLAAVGPARGLDLPRALLGEGCGPIVV
jgi:hypothetical protein